MIKVSLFLQPNFIERTTYNIARYLRTSSTYLNRTVPLYREDIMFNKQYDVIPGPPELPVVGTLLPYILGKILRLIYTLDH